MNKINSLLTTIVTNNISTCSRDSQFASYSSPTLILRWLIISIDVFYLSYNACACEANHTIKSCLQLRLCCAYLFLYLSLIWCMAVLVIGASSLLNLIASLSLRSQLVKECVVVNWIPGDDYLKVLIIIYIRVLWRVWCFICITYMESFLMRGLWFL